MERSIYLSKSKDEIIIDALESSNQSPDGSSFLPFQFQVLCLLFFSPLCTNDHAKKKKKKGSNIFFVRREPLSRTGLLSISSVTLWHAQFQPFLFFLIVLLFCAYQMIRIFADIVFVQVGWARQVTYLYIISII